MTKIEITKPRHHWWQRTRTYSREIAGNWTELDDSSRLFCVRELLQPLEIAAKTRILKRLLRVPKSIFNQLSDDNLSVLIDKLDWMTLEAASAPLVSGFEWQGIRYVLPKAKFEDGTAIEFPIADRFLEAFVKSGDEADLLNLVGTLARETQNGKRVALQSREEAEIRAEILRGLPMEVSMSVMLYFVGVKEYIAKNYGDFLFDDDDEDEVASSATAHFPNYGWWGAYLQIAESGVFGSYEQVLQTNFHRIIMFLIEKRKEAKRQQAAFDNQNTKNGVQ